MTMTETTVTMTVSTVTMTVSVTSVVVIGGVSVVDEVDVTEIPVAVVSSIAVGAVGGVLGTGSARLDVGVTVGAVDERVVVLVVETVVAAGATVSTLIGVVRGGNQGNKAE